MASGKPGGTILVAPEAIMRALGFSTEYMVHGVLNAGDALGFVVTGPGLPEREELQDAPYVTAIFQDGVIGPVRFETEVDQTERGRRGRNCPRARVAESPCLWRDESVQPAGVEA